MEYDLVKHLEFVQAVITRMANNSFLLKGWTVTLSTALFALAVNQSKSIFATLALLPALSFWGLDAFYLRRERLYRKLYEDLCNTADHSHKSIERFSLSTARYNTVTPGWFRTLWTPSVILLHGAVIAGLVALILGLHVPQLRRLF